MGGVGSGLIVEVSASAISEGATPESCSGKRRESRCRLASTNTVHASKSNARSSFCPLSIRVRVYFKLMDLKSSAIVD